MVKNLFVLPLAGIMFWSAAGRAESIKLETQDDKISYIIGRQIGESFRRDKINVNLEVLKAAMRESMDGKQSQLSDEQIQEVMMAWQQEQMQKQIQQSQQFMQEFRQQENVTATASGLLYKVERMGDGQRPSPGEHVLVHYEGRLADGTVFDSSYQRGEPATFPVEGVIQGWSEALQLMPVGSKWRLVIPPELGYGPYGAGQAIPPNAVLIFDVELLGIEQEPEF